MNFLVLHNKMEYDGRHVETYARSIIAVLKLKGHTVFDQDKSVIEISDWSPRTDIDYIIDIDCGRNAEGQYIWCGGRNNTSKIPKIAIFVDSHGRPDLHKEISKYYEHVFFAVWARRDLFTEHNSAWWLPNFTDSQWFYPLAVEPKFDFGFFGSKNGLDRADPLKEICEREGYTYDIRQIGTQFKHRWPRTCEAMNTCRFLMNHGQKHDQPNLRTIESMAVRRPLISDYDPKSGINELFQTYKHYIPYEAYTYKGLEEAIDFCIENPSQAQEIADIAYKEVMSKHLVEHRVDQILEVINAKH